MEYYNSLAAGAAIASDKIKNQWKEDVDTVLSYVQDFANSFRSIFSSLTSMRIRQMNETVEEYRNATEEEKQILWEKAWSEYQAAHNLYNLTQSLAYASVIANTAAGAIKALTDFTDPFSRWANFFAVLAAGAAQAIAIYAAPPPQPPKFAQGGIITQPTYGMIGEAGPEAVIPLSRGDQMLANAGIGGPTIVVNVENSYGTPKEEFVRVLEKAMNRRGAFNAVR